MEKKQLYSKLAINNKQCQTKSRISAVNFYHSYHNNPKIARETCSYNNLTDKLSKIKSLKAGHRNFNKSLYGKLSKKIEGKPISFFHYGLTDEQKKSCFTTFHEIFEISKEQLNGTISVGQLWDRKTSIKYLKQNKMFYNKDLLLQEFENMNKEKQKKKKQLAAKKDQQFIKKYKKLVNNTEKQNRQGSRKWSYHGTSPSEACLQMRNQLKDIAKGINGKGKSRLIIRKLQKNYDKMSDIRAQFQDKMITLL